METGYLSHTGHLVLVDTLGIRTYFPALRIDPAGAGEFLGRPMLLRFVCDVKATVRLHRHGFREPGEVVLSRSTMRLLLTGDGVLLVGSSWRSLRMPRWGEFAKARRPRGSSLKPIKRSRGITPPARTAPCVVLVDPQTVVGARRHGANVVLYGVERKELTGFILGRLSIAIEFSAERRAAEFADAFPASEDVAALDASTKPYIDRDRRFVWHKDARKAILYEAIALAMVLFSIGYLLVNRGGSLGQALLTLALGAGLLVYATPSFRRAFSREFLDFIGRWSRAWDDRWAEEARGRAAGFARRMEGLGVLLDGSVDGLATLDGFFRTLPVDTYHRAFAMDAGAYVGEVLIRGVGRDLRPRWRFESENDDIVLALEAMNHWVSPITMVAHVWAGKNAKTLDEEVREQVEGIVRRLPR